MNLTDLWIITPDWLFFRLVRWFKLDAGLQWLFEELDEALDDALKEIAA